MSGGGRGAIKTIVYMAKYDKNGQWVLDRKAHVLRLNSF